MLKKRSGQSFWTKKIAMFAVVSVLAACQSKVDKPVEERSVSELYNAAMIQLKKKNYEEAAEGFNEVERQHPYSDWATRAQLLAAYSYFQDQKYDKAIMTLETFIQLHPAHKSLAYAHYLQGLSYYEQLSPVSRDQKVAELALSSFAELKRRFPKSKYAKDVKLKIALLQDNLAGREMYVGRYYQRKNAHLAAMNRFRKVVRDFQTTKHAEEALHRLVEVYLALGIKKEALATAAVLGHNFKGGEWYAETYLLIKGEDYRSEDIREADSWIGRFWKKDQK